MGNSQVTATSHAIPGGALVEVAGEVDFNASAQVRVVLQQTAAGKPGKIIVDLQQVPYMDSSGVAVLVEALQMQKRAAGKLVLCNLQPKVIGIFEIARLNMVFTIVKDRAAAEQA